MRHARQLLTSTLALLTLAASCGLTAAAAPAASTQRAAATAANGSHRHHRRTGHAACRSRGAGAHQRRGACRASLHGRAPGSKSASSPTPRTSARERTAQLAAAAVAAVLATPCQNTEVIPAGENLALVRAAVLCLVNRERAQNGESPLRLNASLEGAAESHCAEMIAEDYFAHVAPSGETPVERLRQAGYIPGPSFGYVIGENLAWGTYGLATPQSIVNAWIASPEHLANILDARYTETGIGVSAAVPASSGGGAPGATYGQEFGVITG
jgi:uncharacterized protein YkwD